MSARDEFRPASSDGMCSEAVWGPMCDEIDHLRAENAKLAEHPVAEYPHELWCPSIDVCAICADSECDGIGCVSDLDPNDTDDQPHLEQLQAWVRLGRIQEQAKHLPGRRGEPIMTIDTKGFICLATGASASLNSTWFWTCEECGAGITTSANYYVGDTPLRIHREWHAHIRKVSAMDEHTRMWAEEIVAKPAPQENRS